ncbi:MAG: nucleotidyltransferase family protein [Candidatus Methylomirabilota bacterium]
MGLLKSPEAPIFPFLRLFLARMGVALDGLVAPAPAIDWGAVVPLLREYRLRPLAHWLVRECELAIDPTSREELESSFLSAALRYERLRCALRQIADVFAAQQIPAIVLKGPAAAESLYPEPACRPMEDLDLLVRADRQAKAAGTLVELGYSDVTFGPEDFRNPATGITVDLHVELLNTTRFPVRRKAWQADLEAYWRRASPLCRENSELLTLHPFDQFSYLCHHFWLHHGLRSPRNLLDICLAWKACCGGARLPEDISTHPSNPPAGQPAPESAICHPPFAIPTESRGPWYALGACRSRLGLALPKELLLGCRPAKVGKIEGLLHRAGCRGFLPEAARYGYLWMALHGWDRLEMCRQLLKAARQVC